MCNMMMFTIAPVNGQVHYILYQPQMTKPFTHRWDGHDGPWQAVYSHSLCHNMRGQTENIKEAKDDIIGS